MVEFYALIFICHIGMPCIEVRESYLSVESCKADKETLSRIYGTNIIFCVKGNVTDDRWETPLEAAIDTDVAFAL